MNIRLILAMILSVSLLLVACGDENTIINPGGGTDNGGDDNGNGDDNGDVGNGDNEDTPFMFGSGEGDDFQDGVLGMGLATIASGGSTGVYGRVLDEDGEPATDRDWQVEFSSSCLSNDEAAINSPVPVNDNGEFSATYQAQGCFGEDVLTARAVSTGAEGAETTLSANATLNIESASLGTLIFVEADPDFIGLKGMGNMGIPENSAVTFLVEDANGNPMPDTAVEFWLSTTVGGLELSAEETVTDSAGQATVNLMSGTAATPVHVNARVVETQVASQSSAVTVSTGIAEEQGVSIAFETLNPPVAGCVGEEVEVSFHARDRFSNPVVDGTIVHFSTEGGRIDSSCQLEDGSCSVTWTSQAPMPSRSTVLAYMQGEESFRDRTGDGLFGEEEAGFGPSEDDYDFNNPDVDEDVGWVDTGEPYRDDNESGSFDPGADSFFWDYYQTGFWSEPNGVWDGALCGAGIEDDGDREQFKNDYCGSENAPVGRSGVMVLADNLNPQIDADDAFTVGSGPFEFSVSDINGQPLPNGTEVSFAPGYGEVLGEDSITIGNTNIDGPIELSFNVTESGEEDLEECEIGVIQVTTPGNSCSAGSLAAHEVTVCGSES
ncbi:protocatechuate 3,4-dioxygenase beta subunit [Natronospira proteinivora]|uniref:Protocatechuate 3,4-dioxygenase beta subunit n=1 Tax=Natronospira proteinivora TaxID=1807133 RepID=A0ABT1G9K7_9GAMM|nr:Ig-like domain-containing protein [Natronospira proteinivora]MCP1728001.1 protocatechuate 3,4-dioxygenase beta subunit [Natronospira proteinivora]